MKYTLVIWLDFFGTYREEVEGDTLQQAIERKEKEIKKKFPNSKLRIKTPRVYSEEEKQAMEE